VQPKRHFAVQMFEFGVAHLPVLGNPEPAGQRLLDPLKYRSYGVHYTDPRTTPPSNHHVDFCLSIEKEVGLNSARDC